MLNLVAAKVLAMPFAFLAATFSITCFCCGTPIMSIRPSAGEGSSMPAAPSPGYTGIVVTGDLMADTRQALLNWIASLLGNSDFANALQGFVDWVFANPIALAVALLLVIVATLALAFFLLIRLPLMLLRLAGRGVGRLPGSVGRRPGNIPKPSPGSIPSLPKLKIDPRQLQRKFDRRHAEDFGIKGNWNKANGKAFQKAIEDFVGNKSNRVIDGPYRKQGPARYFVNLETNQMVLTKLDGTFWTAYKLGPNQLRDLLTHGGL